MSNAMLAACWQIQLPPTAKAVLIALADSHNSKDGVAIIVIRSMRDPPRLDLITKTGLSERAIKGAIGRAPSISPVIIIQEEAFGQGFDVLVCPPHREGLAREFPSYRRAHGYALGLSAALGLSIRDRSGKSQ